MSSENIFVCEIFVKVTDPFGISTEEAKKCNKWHKKVFCEAKFLITLKIAES